VPPPLTRPKYSFHPWYDFLQTGFFGKPMDNSITEYDQISWQPIYNMNMPVAFRGAGGKHLSFKS
jgi:hypothetical protein